MNSSAKIEDRMEKTRAKIARLRAEERRLKSSLLTSARRADTRRKILIGSWLLDQSGGDSGALGRRMEGWLTRPADRKLFGLPPAE